MNRDLPKFTRMLLTFFACFMQLGDAYCKDLTEILYEHGSKQLDASRYRDATPNVADYWDCSGYSIRACQILIALDYSCQIAVAGGHAFIVVSGNGIAPTYFEPQLGRDLLPIYPTLNPTIYPLEDYIRYFQAQHCTMPAEELPNGTFSPSAEEVADPPSTEEVQDRIAAIDEAPITNTETEKELWVYQGVYYKCPKGMSLVVDQYSGRLECQQNGVGG